MFNELSEKLEAVFKNIRGQGKLTESNIRDAMRDIRRSLLEADVNFKVAKRFIASVQEKALGQEVLSSITPGQMIVKIVHDELVELLGGTAAELHVKGSPERIMVCGLQGSGKTTSVAKLAQWISKNGRKPMVASVDVHRPAAIEQLKVLAESAKIACAQKAGSGNPLEIVKSACVTVETSPEHDALILDTAGRLHVDQSMMEELRSVVTAFEPHHIFFVADGMTGQDAVNAVKGFTDVIEFDGVILTKMDGDARGGAALSIKEVTGKPIYFVGTGEKIGDFEKFHPERFASRILGMGDVVTLVERAQDVVDEKKARKLQEKIATDKLSLEDFLDQLRQLKKMGPLENVLGMLPGANKMMKGFNFTGDELKRVEAIILSMTPRERDKPSIIDGSRRKRIARGSGTSVNEVNNLLKQFATMRKMMKKMSHAGNMKSMRGMGMPF